MTYPVAILAGGLATRLRPITETIPKSLIPIADKPFLSYQLELLKKNKLKDIVLCVGFLGDMIAERFGDGSDYGLNIQYSFDGMNLLGTGGALKNACSILGSTFYVLYGDSYLPIDYLAVAKRFSNSNKQGLMTVYKNKGKWDTSNVWLDSGEIKIYDKTQNLPQMEHIDYGLSILTSSALSDFPEKEKFDLSDVFRALIAKQELIGYEVSERFYEIGSKSGISEFEAMITNL